MRIRAIVICILLFSLLATTPFYGCGKNETTNQVKTEPTGLSKEPSKETTGHSTKLIDHSLFSSSGWDHLSSKDRYLANLPPDASLISLHLEEDKNVVTLIGSETSVPPNSSLLVANLELGTVKTLKASPQGSFSLTMDAYPGTSILIKQDFIGHRFPLTENVTSIVEGESIPVPGIILTIPGNQPSSGFKFHGGARVTANGPPWLATGEISNIAFDIDDELSISGKIHILTDIGIRENVSLSIKVLQLADEDGTQMGPYGRFVSRLLTPSKLPIEIPSHSGSNLQSCGHLNLIWPRNEQSQVANFSCNTKISGDIPRGTYLLQLIINVDEDAAENIERFQEDKLLKFPSELGGNLINIATIKIGNPQPVYLSTSLFADILQEGSRGGIISNTASDNVVMSPRTITHHNPVIPRMDPFGDLLNHSLEPYLPMFGITDRSPPSVPLLDFDFDNSSLTITVERPDGQVDILGPTPIISYAVNTPSTPFGQQISGGGNHIGEIPQLIGKNGELAYSFPLDGDYTIKLSGSINNLHGQKFNIEGRYEITVANSLDIETNLLPGTPFEVGNSLPIGLSIIPNVPAEIQFNITHIAEDLTEMKRIFTGEANKNGEWDGDGNYFQFESPGEYRIDVEARFKTQDNNMWVGRITYGGIVATPDSPIMAHGRRGHDGTEEVQPPWGFGADLPSDGHLQFPFFTGDILWGSQDEINRLDGSIGEGPGDSVNTVLSYQVIDESPSLIYKALQIVENRKENYADLITAGQIPLITQVLEYEETDNPFKGQNPEDYSLLSYSYGSAQRPGVRVREIIQGEDTSAYWRFNDSYHLQSGNGVEEGDLPDDFKFLYGGAVIRDMEKKSGIFAIYGSGWVHAEIDDPLGSRFMPPFQGNAGGPNGGPLFNIHNRDIDMFFMPMGTKPGSIQEIGDVFKMAGPIMPTLPVGISYSVTAPDGTSQKFQGKANSIGYFYDPTHDFVLNQGGIWTVEVGLLYDGMTSAGPTTIPYPTGGVLSPDGKTYSFLVTGDKSHFLPIATNLSATHPDDWYGHIADAKYQALLPEGWDGTEARVLVNIPGLILVDENLEIRNGLVTWDLIAKKLNSIASNFDYARGIADTITVSFHAENKSGEMYSGLIASHGARVPIPPLAPEIQYGANHPWGKTECRPNETLLFSSDFENGHDGWDFSDGSAWSVVQFEDSKVLKGQGHVHAYLDGQWDEVVWRMKTRIVSGNVHFNFHTDYDRPAGTERYILSYGPNSTNLSNAHMDVGSGRKHPINEWHVIEFGLSENVLWFGSDGLPEIKQLQPNPLPAGGIDIEILDSDVKGTGEAFFDDVVICSPN